MRLKPCRRGGALLCSSSMNQKNLNYEIETVLTVLFGTWSDFAMNQKNLNYEIETRRPQGTQRSARLLPMNQKNLNYEIETS